MHLLFQIRTINLSVLLVSLALIPTNIQALDMDITNTESRNAGLALLAKGLMDYYNGDDYGETPGMFSSPYYWWEAGAAWNSMLDYWFYTGDETYNDVLKRSLLFQVGDDWDYMPSNQTTTEGNDDQGFWGITVMAAAEKNFTNPNDDEPQWLYLAQAVFNTMASRWDTQHCGGGLRWQIFTWNNGYNYKNTVSNGCLFNIAARLYRFTQNETYGEWAEKTWDWVETMGYINSSSDSWPVYDGGFISDNCTEVSALEWTYNTGLFLSGAAFMYNHTGDAKWLTRITHIWSRSTVFFLANSKIMYEAACQPTGRCNNDQRCFKAIFSRFLGHVCLLAPEMNDEIQTYLLASAQGVITSCSGGTDGHTCGLDWSQDGWDGMYGLGEQMSALELLLNTQVWTRPPPLTSDTGASSTGNGSAGTGYRTNTYVSNDITVTSKDRAGAGIITAVVIVLMLGVAWWMVV
ncbi:uncharacterized protein SAPINGB_P005775 [Magnusiomyces paraingens]|uniref:Mannan endo-1,6-alpha-mannosidase n=1 Tax=Magnusiomyces paraingens TaxID=2606893 RepID=A0A5E8C6U9_9ASCO|nr:uncharacterized protein SAPINGB_P005775 [Saprochaete ingens]VVT57598.1 unnamed protein product [Saprochaete ingens]